MNNIFINNYISFGYSFLNPILKKSDLLDLRDLLDDYFLQAGNPSQLNLHEIDDAALSQALLDLIFDKSIIDAIGDMQESFGVELSPLPGFIVMRNYFPNPYGIVGGGWHADCGGETSNIECKPLLKNASYVFGKVGIPLQENGVNGGSIDVIPCTQILMRHYRIFVRVIKMPGFYLYKLLSRFRALNMLMVSKDLSRFFFNGKTLCLPPSAPIFFDSGLLHRGTPPHIAASKGSDINCDFIPDDLMPSGYTTKYTLYFHFGSIVGCESYLLDRYARKSGAKEMNDWIKAVDFISNKNNLISPSFIEFIKKFLSIRAGI